MKKVLACLTIFTLITACSSQPKPTPSAQQTEIIATTQTASKYASDYERFSLNVSIKENSATHIVYEYKDVRLDEIAMLAKRYCLEQGQNDVIFREAVLTKNFSRQATFDCIILQ